MIPDNQPDQTPIEVIPEMDIAVKWDDQYAYAGIRGGKVRACHTLATAKVYDGLITASARKSPQAQIVARIANRLGVPARIHMPQGKATPEMEDMLAHGAELVQHKAGYNNVIISRARDDARKRPTWGHIPFGMADTKAMACTTTQVASVAAMHLPPTRIVVPVGSGMSLCGILHGLVDHGLKIPVIGIQVGANPHKRIQAYAPPFSGHMYTIHDHTKHVGYATPVNAEIGGRVLDPIYEAKCVEYLQPGDLFWVVGIRQTGEENDVAVD